MLVNVIINLYNLEWLVNIWNEFKVNLVCLVVYMLFIYVNSKVDLRVIDVGLVGI